MKRVKGDSARSFKAALNHLRGAARKLRLTEAYLTTALRKLEREREVERTRIVDAMPRNEVNPAGVP